MSSRAAAAGTKSPARDNGRAKKAGSAKPGIRITVRSAVLFVLVAILAVSAIYPVRLLIEQRHTITSLELQTQKLQQTNAVYAAQVRKLQDPTYLEQLARECFGMVKKGQTAFVVIPKNGKPAADSCTPSAGH